MSGASRLGPVAWCLGAAALFGASAPAAKLLVAHVGPFSLAGLLYLGAALAVAPWAIPARRRRRPMDGRNRRRVAGAVLAGGVIAPALLMSALALAPAGSVALWLTLETAATAVLGRALFGEQLRGGTWAAVALTIVASALLAWGVPEGGPAALLVGLACVAWGLDNNLTAVVDGITAAELTGLKGAVAGAVNIGLGVALGEATATPSLVPALAVGALGYGASLLLYIAAAQQLGAVRSQLVFATAPAFGFVVAWLALGEPVAGVQLGALALMGAAFWLWHRERHDHAHAHAAVTHTHRHRHDDGHHAHAHPLPVAAGRWHVHEHSHEAVVHAHPHRPDLHHRHDHG